MSFFLVGRSDSNFVFAELFEADTERDAAKAWAEIHSYRNDVTDHIFVQRVLRDETAHKFAIKNIRVHAYRSE